MTTEAHSRPPVWAAPQVPDGDLILNQSNAILRPQATPPGVWEDPVGAVRVDGVNKGMEGLQTWQPLLYTDCVSISIINI